MSLPYGSQFNIYKFSSFYEPFKNSSVEYTKENVVEARKWIDSIRAMGGTELINVLQYVFWQPVKPNY